MNHSGNAATGRRAVTGLLQGRLDGLIPLAMLVLLAFAWSGTALAQSCDVLVQGSTAASGPPLGTVTFTLQVPVPNACVGAVAEGTITIASDGTNGASVSPATYAIPEGGSQTITVTLGPDAGQTGTVFAECTDGGCSPFSDHTLDFATDSDIQFTATTPTVMFANNFSPYVLGTHLTVDGSSYSGVTVNFRQLPSGIATGVVTDGAGNADRTLSTVTAGTYSFEAALQCPMDLSLPGCASVPPIVFTVTVGGFA